MNMQPNGTPAGSRGFTLIELMIAVVILGIVSSFALSSYQKSIQKTNRASAKSTLGKISGAEETWRFSHNSYASTVTSLIGAIPATVSVNYTFTIASSGSTYTAAATATGGQLKDTDCKTFALNYAGLQTAINAAGSTSSSITSNCWGG